jgi:asparagine synthase (glutamine-hydrolysing)
MCGFVGIWNYQAEPVDIDLLVSMRDSLSHRGPDDQGLHIDQGHGLGLGFRRLAIIDLTDDGRQPMTNEDQSLWMVFNGEIYNHLPLRNRLIHKGHRFRSRSDSETIVHLFEERRETFVVELNGMFAVAIWDARRRELILARDRVGKKPLFYFDDGTRLVFASELKALLADPSIRREIDIDALHQYLALGYVATPRTIFRNIHKLRPGHVAVVRNGSMRVSQYWDWLELLSAARGEATRSPEEWSAELKELVDDSVRDRLFSDVPLGAFLSGGVDSSCVVSSMARQQGKVKTFSIGFPKQPYSELQFARLIAAKYGTDHHELVVTAADVLSLVPALARDFDEPFADSSAVPTYFVSKLAREHVRVVLTGDGSDEIFGGYARYGRGLMLAPLDAIPLFLRQLFGFVTRLIPADTRMARITELLSLPPDVRYSRLVQSVPIRWRAEALAGDAWAWQAADGFQPIEAALQRAVRFSSLTRMQYCDLVTYLLDDILVKVDRATMANSLEARCPFLDVRLLQFAASLPDHLRYWRGQGKWILKRAFAADLPKAITGRAKQGFRMPIREWLKGDLGNLARDVLLSSRAISPHLFRPEALDRLLRRHETGAALADETIWSLLVLELWFDQVAATASRTLVLNQQSVRDAA